MSLRPKAGRKLIFGVYRAHRMRFVVGKRHLKIKAINVVVSE